MRYGYTPDGAMRYKAAKKMMGMDMPDKPKSKSKSKSTSKKHKMPDGTMMAGKKHSK